MKMAMGQSESSMDREEFSMHFKSSPLSDIRTFLVMALFSSFNNFVLFFYMMLLIFFEYRRIGGLSVDIFYTPIQYYTVAWFIVSCLQVRAMMGYRISYFKSYDVDILWGDKKIKQICNGEETIYDRSAIRKVCEIAGNIVIFINKYPKIVIPVSSFVERDGLQYFRELVGIPVNSSL